MRRLRLLKEKIRQLTMQASHESAFMMYCHEPISWAPASGHIRVRVRFRFRVSVRVRVRVRAREWGRVSAAFGCGRGG